MKKSIRLNFRTTPAFLSELNTYCEEQGISKTQVIESAVHFMIEQDKLQAKEEDEANELFSIIANNLIQGETQKVNSEQLEVLAVMGTKVDILKQELIHGRLIYTVKMDLTDTIWCVDEGE